MKHVLSTLACMVLVHAVLFAADGASDIQAFHREGQTFITFQEDSSVSGERYHIYQSTTAITQESLNKLQAIAILEEGSAHLRFPTERFKTLKEIGIKNAIIQDIDQDGKELTDGTGLMVWTASVDAVHHYAVIMETAGKKSLFVANSNALAQPIVETVQTPGAVKIFFREPSCWVYMYWNDYALWNQRTIDDCPIGICNVFQIMLPKNKKLWEKPLPVEIEPHGYGALSHMVKNSNSQKSIKILPKNFMNTWHYGHSNALTKENYNDKKFKVIDKGEVVDYFWREMKFLLDWVAKAPKNFPAVKSDSERIYMVGFSQGGTGTNTVGIRQGDRFAAIRPDKGICNWLRENINGKIKWQKTVWRYWGTPENPLQTFEGENIYERMDIPKWLRQHPEVEIPYMQISHARFDGSISFEAYPEYFRSLQEARQAFTGSWNQLGHFPTGQYWKQNGLFLHAQK
ncbi:MAG: prolyl oligopeptidase family serine peptidase [Planctomycetes bacterium]|nr:prolyl oligopeptidase family serine peptidase [Planctomycetota bacterium]